MVAMDAPEVIFRSYLKQRGLKFTMERRVLLQAIQDFGRPFEAEELLLLLREREQRISRATIYRTIRNLLEAGMLKQVHFGTGKQAHYDFTAGGDVNDYLLDLDTGRILPFSSELVAKICDKIAHEMGFEVVSQRFQIYARRLPTDKPPTK